MGFVIDLKPFANRRKREEQKYERQQKALDMRASLEERGLEPEEANAAVQEWVKSGQWNVPTERTTFPQMEPGPDGKMAYGPPSPVRQPISLRKRQELEVPYVIGEDGKMTAPQMEDGFLDQLTQEGYKVKPKFEVGKERKPAARTDGVDIIVDADGNVVRRLPNNTDSNKTVTLSRKPAGGDSDANDPQKRAALQTLAQYDRMLEAGDNISPDLEHRAAQAAEFIGLPVEDITNKPGFFGRLIGKKDTTYQRPGFVKQPGPPKAVPEPTRKRAEEFLKANGKPLTPANIAAVVQRGLVK